jgi:hypothetical protein
MQARIGLGAAVPLTVSSNDYETVAARSSPDLGLGPAGNYRQQKGSA